MNKIELLAPAGDLEKLPFIWLANCLVFVPERKILRLKKWKKGSLMPMNAERKFI